MVVHKSTGLFDLCHVSILFQVYACKAVFSTSQTFAYVCVLSQIEVCQGIYNQGSRNATDAESDEENSPSVVGHNVYILAYQLSQHKKELKVALDKAGKQEGAIQHYAENTAQIEVGWGWEFSWTPSHPAPWNKDTIGYKNLAIKKL